MNNRIQELAKQANLTEVIDDAYLARNDWQPFVEKFAELIVHECAESYHRTRPAGEPIETFFLRQLGLNG